MVVEQEFEARGFLADCVSESVTFIRSESAEWFALADEISDALQRTAMQAKQSIKGSSLDPKVIATLLLMRTCGNFQGAILLLERGLLPEAKTLIRSCVEASFCLAALHDSPDEFVELLRADDDASRRAQANFILTRSEFDSTTPEARDRLQKIVDSIPKSKNMGIFKLAEMGPYLRQYLYYKVLSHDAAHVSARSLHRHMNVGEKGWYGFVWGQGSKSEVDETLDLGCAMVLGVGVAFTNIVDDLANNAAFEKLSARQVTLRT